MACIAEQLFAIHRISAHVSEAEPERLKVIVRTVLAMPHTVPLVLVLDGLDEITDPVQTGEFALGPYWFPETLGDNVHVVLGVRFAPGLENLEKLRDKLALPAIDPFEMDNLAPGAIRELLDAPHQHLADAIHHKTRGLANYVVAVTDAVNQSRNADGATAQLGRLPENFGDYANKAMDGALRQNREWLDPLGFLAAASGPLTKSELLRLCATSRDQLRESDLRRPPWDIARWLIQESGAWSFQHDAIAEARRDGMEYELGSFRERLLDDCAAWASHRDPYSLIHYTDDLLQEIRGHEDSGDAWEALYTLALSDDFRAAQRDQVPQQSSLPLRAIQTAIRVVVTRNDPLATVSLMLAHLEAVNTLRNESPGQSHYREVPSGLDSTVTGGAPVWTVSLGTPLERISPTCPIPASIAPSVTTCSRSSPSRCAE